MNYYFKALKNYSNFEGRAGRTEFWIYQLVYTVLTFITISADRALGTCFKYDLGYGVQLLPFGYVFAVYGLATLLPTMAVQIRRLHDTGKTGWLLFLSIIPILGAVCLLILNCLAGTPGHNKYGPDPEQIQPGI